MKKHLFTIWLTNNDWDGMPLLNEICIASVQVCNNVPVTIYTNNKLHLSFLDDNLTNIVQIPKAWLDDAEKYCGYNKAHQSDYLRLLYLSQKPGIYFDTDILFWNDFDTLINKMEQADIMYIKEDKYMITNCCIFSKNPNGVNAKLFFKDMLWNYQNRFIRHSYIFNSQKYMNLMEQRHSYTLKCLEEPEWLFKAKWDASNFSEFFERKECVGIGQHLYNSIKEWDWIRNSMLLNIYEPHPTEFPFQVTKEVIDRYINLMMEEDKNVTRK